MLEFSQVAIIFTCITFIYLHYISIRWSLDGSIPCIKDALIDWFLNVIIFVELNALTLGALPEMEFQYTLSYLARAAREKNPHSPQRMGGSCWLSSPMCMSAASQVVSHTNTADISFTAKKLNLALSLFYFCFNRKQLFWRCRHVYIKSDWTLKTKCPNISLHYCLIWIYRKVKQAVQLPCTFCQYTFQLFLTSVTWLKFNYAWVSFLKR